MIDTGANPWHSHVRGRVDGCRIYATADGAVGEDGDFRDPVGHGTAVAGVLREALPEAELFAVRVFGEDLTTYPTLVARGVLRAAAEGCGVINLSLAVPPGAGAEALAEACAAAIEAGCALVAAAHPGHPGWLPAALPHVHRAAADDRLPFGAVRRDPDDPLLLFAPGRPRDLEGLPRAANLWGSSFACARVSAHLAGALGATGVTLASAGERARTACGPRTPSRSAGPGRWARFDPSDTGPDEPCALDRPGHPVCNSE